MSGAATILWFRADLRLADQPAVGAALDRALELGGAVLPLFIWAPDDEGDWAPGAATRWWLHHSLAALDRDLRERGSRLLIRRAGKGGSAEVIAQLAAEAGAAAVVWSRRYEPTAVARDAAIKSVLKGSGLRADSVNSSLLFEPWDVKTGEGGPYKVFTPFWRACLARGAVPAPLPAPGRIPSPNVWPRGDSIESLALLPRVSWDGGLRSAWKPGEAGAAFLLERFLEEAVLDYPEGRDRPDREGVSRLSPHLHFGELSPRQAWAAAEARAARAIEPGAWRAVQAWQRQIVWREFAHHLLFHFPHTTDHPLREQYASFPWSDPATDRSAAAALEAWKRGRTGFPVVDAGLRELWTTGWMHNRVRMIAASFLVKDLLIPWQEGARWFWDTLVDADLANNTLGWQWTAGCGADAAPFFRIFSPVLQGMKFDPRGTYIRRWIPELARVPDEWIHRPSEAPGYVPGRDYPAPIVNHAAARERALAALAATRQAGAAPARPVRRTAPGGPPRRSRRQPGS